MTDLTILYNSKQRELHSLLAVLSVIGLSQQISRKKVHILFLSFHILSNSNFVKVLFDIFLISPITSNFKIFIAHRFEQFQGEGLSRVDCCIDTVIPYLCGYKTGFLFL